VVDGRNIDVGREGGDGGDGPWFMFVFLCVWRDCEKYGWTLKSKCILELIDQVRLAIIKLADNMARSMCDKMLVCHRVLL
jgi:hypothetical protein